MLYFRKSTYVTLSRPSNPVAAYDKIVGPRENRNCWLDLLGTEKKYANRVTYLGNLGDAFGAFCLHYIIFDSSRRSKVKALKYVSFIFNTAYRYTYAECKNLKVENYF